MAHDLHFLQRLHRATPEQTDRALSLYRDPALVRTLLEDSRIPADAPRVAIALEEGPGSPHVIVERNGRFVTCLGPGMTVGSTPVFSRARLDAALTRVERDRTGEATLARIQAESPRGIRRLYARIHDAGPYFAREDLQPLLDMHPISPSTHIEGAAYSFVETHKELPHSANQDFVSDRGCDAHIRSMWENYWCGLHEMVLAGSGTAEDFGGAVAGALAFYGPLTIGHQGPLLGAVLRFAWVFARVGREGLPILKNLYRAEPVLEGRVTLACAFAALGLRNARMRAEMQKLLDHGTPELSLYAPEASEFGMELDRIVRERFCGVLEDPAPFREEARASFGAESQKRFGTPDAAVALAAGAIAPIFSSEEALFGLASALPMLVEAPAIELFLTRAQVERMPAYTRDDGNAWVASTQIARQMRVPQVPIVKTEPKVGRNDPCACGSGKKAKKCCAA